MEFCVPVLWPPDVCDFPVRDWQGQRGSPLPLYKVILLARRSPVSTELLTLGVFVVPSEAISFQHQSYESQLCPSPKRELSPSPSTATQTQVATLISYEVSGAQDSKWQDPTQGVWEPLALSPSIEGGGEALAQMQRILEPEKPEPLPLLEMQLPCSP
ncbi:Nuclease EXOG, mitochondrial [Manis javanica]|nr:Nuclease EXOG, mitochondrial [Manis javanica]